MKQNGNFDEFNKINETEFNNFFDENNILDIKNEEQVYNKFGDNKNLNIGKKVNVIKLISSFIIVCAIAAVIQTVFPIPLFSQLFNPVQMYSFETISATFNKVSYSVSLRNIDDFSSNEYCLMVVKSGCDNDGYISSIPVAIKGDHKVKITTSMVKGNFNEYVTSDGAKRITKNTNYVILILKNEEIVQKKSIKTENFIYFTEIKTNSKTDKSYKYLLIQVTPNSLFDKFNSVYFELYNLTLDRKVNDYSIINKDDLSTSWASIPLDINDPVYDFELRLYCSTASPEDIEYSNSFVKDEINYYFIYTYDSVIKI